MEDEKTELQRDEGECSDDIFEYVNELQMVYGDCEGEAEEEGPPKKKFCPEKDKPVEFEFPEFELKLNEYELKAYLDTHETYVAFRKEQPTLKKLHWLFGMSPNPYELVLKFFTHSGSYANCKVRSFTFFVIEALDEYKKTNQIKPGLLDAKLKLVILNCVKTNITSVLFPIIVRAFELDQTPEIFVPYIDSLVARGDYGGACVLSIKIALDDTAAIQKFMMPCLFIETRNTDLVNYLKAFPNIQVPFLQEVDKFANLNALTVIYCNRLVRKHNYQNLPEKNFTSEYLLHAMNRLRKRCQLPLDDTLANLKLHKGLKALSFLVARFTLQAMPPQVFRDNVKLLVQRDNVQLQLHLILKLLRYKRSSAALEWLQYFGFEMDDLPGYLKKSIFAAMEHERGTKLLECATTRNPNKYVINPKKVSIQLVDSGEQFEEMMGRLNSATWVALNFEWIPSYVGSPALALAKLACKNRVYIVDALSIKIKDENWMKIEELLNNNNIKKICYGFFDKYRSLQKLARPSLKVSTTKYKEDFLDLRHFFRFLESKQLAKTICIRKELISLPGKRIRLSDYCWALLGKDLEINTFYACNWATRPLPPWQIHLAATNIYVLLDIMTVIEDELIKIPDSDNLQDLMATYAATCDEYFFKTK